MAGCVVRLAAREDLDWIMKIADDMGWKPGCGDEEAYWAADNTGFYVGELNGQIISSVALVKYGSSFANVGFYAVAEPYREKGLGYGLKTFQTGMDSLPEGCNVTLDCKLDKERMYERSGFKRTWTTTRRLISVSTAVSTFRDHSPSFGVVIKPVQEISFDKIYRYDTECFQKPRQPLFLEKWITLPGRKSFVAINAQRDVVGIIVARPTVRLDKDGYRIGPLFADSDDIAYALMKSVIEAMIADGNLHQTLIIDIPDSNKNGVKMADDLHAERVFQCIRMFTKDPFQYPGEKIYGFTTLDIG